MNKLSDDIPIVILISILVIGALILAFFYPYKETLTCEKTVCTVNASFLIPFEKYRTSYIFNRDDELLIRHTGPSRRGSGGYLIKKRVSGFKSDDLVFINSFFSKKVVLEIINKIHSSENDIQIDKYWYGYKIK